MKILKRWILRNRELESLNPSCSNQVWAFCSELNESIVLKRIWVLDGALSIHGDLHRRREEMMARRRSSSSGQTRRRCYGSDGGWLRRRRSRDGGGAARKIRKRGFFRNARYKRGHSCDQLLKPSVQRLSHFLIALWPALFYKRTNLILSQMF